MASAVFYYGEGRFRSNSQDPASLFDAHDLLSQYVGKGEWHTLGEQTITSLMKPSSCWCAVCSRTLALRPEFDDHRDSGWPDRFGRILELVNLGPSFIIHVEIFEH